MEIKKNIIPKITIKVPTSDWQEKNIKKSILLKNYKDKK